jgi:peptidoglycan/LPS O-acetylase OafA/YrhL
VSSPAPPMSQMSQAIKLRKARALTTIALVVACIGFVIQMAAGVTNTPTIPPGLIAIVVAAGLVAFVPARWVPLAGTAAGLLNLGAFITVGATDRLFEANPEAAFVAVWCMVVALVVASIAGILATIQGPPGAAGGKRVHEPSQGHRRLDVTDVP